jgi:hypothetical protein
MCFSPEASFTGGLIISAIGIAAVTKIHKPEHLLFASIPLFFGIQQFMEGALWLTIPNPDYINTERFCTYIFLVMADVLWPVMIPLSVLFMEKNPKRKRILRILLIMGITLSAYYAICMVSYSVTPEISGYHIHYKTDFPKSLAMVAFIVYLIVTITPLFVSSIKKTHLLGVLMFLSCCVTAIFFTQFLTSVWCFFAALISGVIFWILSDSKREFIFNKLSLLKVISNQQKTGGKE